MVTTSRSRLFLGSVLVLASVAFIPSAVRADHAWGYHWARTTQAVPLTLGNSVGAIWQNYLFQAEADWDQSSVLDLNIVAGATSPNSCRPKKGAIEVCSAAYGFNGWLGLARIWVNGVHITAASTQVNDTYFNTSAYNTAAWRQYVMCQEIGHDFGLDHTDENFSNPNDGSCMDYTEAPQGGGFYGPANTSPNSHDYAELLAIYNHFDSGGGGRRGGAAAPGLIRFAPGSDDDDQPGQSEWGQLVRANGRLAVYRLNLGGGNLVFTFVIWS